EQIDAGAAQFKRSLTLTAEWAEIDLTDATFGGSSSIGSSRAVRHAEPELEKLCQGSGQHLPAERQRRATRLSPGARIVSLRGAHLGELTISGIDLRPCLFAGAHNLEKLRLEGGNVLAANPRGDRQTVAEEHGYRAGHSRWRPSRWQPPPVRSPSLLEPKP